MEFNLGYRLERLIKGESGIVERVETIEVPLNESRGNYEDDDGNLPQDIAFRNPLGELSIGASTMVRKDVRTKSGNFYQLVYKEYKVGDQYP